jgi:hypothetical protein
VYCPEVPIVIVICPGLSKSYKKGDGWGVCSDRVLIMLVFHHTHWHVFYKDSSFSPRVPVAVNCYTFDALCCLLDGDADLFFCMGRCFMCRTAVHRTEKCSLRGPPVLLCKRLEDVHSTLVVLRICYVRL